MVIEYQQKADLTVQSSFSDLLTNPKYLVFIEICTDVANIVSFILEQFL